MSIFVLASSSIPDIPGLRHLHRLPADLHDSEVAEFAFQRLRAGRGGDQLAAALQRLAAFAILRFDEDGITSFSRHGEDEADLLRALAEVSAGASRIVRWNEQETSLAALRQRGLLAGLAWPAGHPVFDPACSDELAVWLGAGAGAATPELAMVARLAGLPLQRGFETEHIWQAWLAGDFADILADVERRALAVFVLQLRRLRLDGTHGEGEHEAAFMALCDFLDAAAPRLQDFRPAVRA